MQAHSQVYANGKLLNLEKAPGRQVISVLFSTKEEGIWNEMNWNEMLIASTKIPEHEGSISPSSFYGQLPDYKSHVSALST